jgi:hypothetical protein
VADFGWGLDRATGAVGHKRTHIKRYKRSGTESS